MIQKTQYEVVLVNLDPTIGGEMQKTRPCVILSPDEMNRHLQTIVVAPVTNTSKSYPTRVKIHSRKVKGWIAIDQIRTIDVRRLIKHVDHLSGESVAEVKNVIRETFVL